MVKLGQFSTNLGRGIVDNNCKPTIYMRWMPTTHGTIDKGTYD